MAEIVATMASLPGWEMPGTFEAAAVHRILRKVLHRPTVRAKEFSASPKGPVYLEALQQLFDLSTGEAQS